MDLFLWLGIVFATSLVLGMILEKIRIPWLFAPLLLGIGANLMNIHPEHISNFNFLAELGMYFMLFIIGFKIDLEEFKKLGKEILKDTLVINIASSILNTIVLIAIGFPFMVSLVAGIAISTVGEEVLVPILEEFGLLKRKLGTMIVGIGVFDDIFEVIAIILAGTLVATKASVVNPEAIFLGLAIPVILTLAFTYTKGLKSLTRKVPIVEDLILIGLAIFFVYMSIGGMAGAEGMGAILAGISLKNLVSNKDLKKTEYALDMITYGLFGPLFFAWIGMSVNIASMWEFPMLTIILYLVPTIGKILSGYIATINVLGKARAWILGTALSVRFSTQLVVAQFLFSNGVIGSGLFTAIVVSSAIATIINPFLMIGALQKKNQ